MRGREEERKRGREDERGQWVLTGECVCVPASLLFPPTRHEKCNSYIILCSHSDKRTFCAKIPSFSRVPALQIKSALQLELPWWACSMWPPCASEGRRAHDGFCCWRFTSHWVGGNSSLCVSVVPFVSAQGASRVQVHGSRRACDSGQGWPEEWVARSVSGWVGWWAVGWISGRNDDSPQAQRGWILGHLMHWY